MRYLLSIVFLALVSFAPQPANDPRVNVTPSSVSSDKLTLLNTDSDFLQIRFSTVHKKGYGLQAVTISTSFLATTDLYGSPSKRQFSLIVDGQRTDFGSMFYQRYSVEERDGKSEFYVGTTHLDREFPDDVKVIGVVPINKLVAGSLAKIIVLPSHRDAFERIRRSKKIALKIGPHRVSLTDDQVKALQDFIQRAANG